MGQIRRVAFVATALAMLAGNGFAADTKPAEPAKTTSTTDRLKVKKKAPSASLEKKAAAAPVKPAAPRHPVKAGS
jgi:hypothetical protein